MRPENLKKYEVTFRLTANVSVIVEGTSEGDVTNWASKTIPQIDIFEADDTSVEAWEIEDIEAVVIDPRQERDET